VKEIYKNSDNDDTRNAPQPQMPDVGFPDDKAPQIHSKQNQEKENTERNPHDAILKSSDTCVNHNGKEPMEGYVCIWLMGSPHPWPISNQSYRSNIEFALSGKGSSLRRGAPAPLNPP
jgi:hypothetical protein